MQRQTIFLAAMSADQPPPAPDPAPPPPPAPPASADSVVSPTSPAKPSTDAKTGYSAGTSAPPTTSNPIAARLAKRSASRERSEKVASKNGLPTAPPDISRARDKTPITPNTASSTPGAGGLLERKSKESIDLAGSPPPPATTTKGSATTTKGSSAANPGPPPPKAVRNSALFAKPAKKPAADKPTEQLPSVAEADSGDPKPKKGIGMGGLGGLRNRNPKEAETPSLDKVSWGAGWGWEACVGFVTRQGHGSVACRESVGRKFA